MPGLLRFFLVTTFLLAVGTVAAACGDGKAELTLEEYFQRLQTIATDLEERGEAIGSELGEHFDPETGELPSFDTLQRLLSESVSAFQGALNEAESLDPPSEVDSAHDEFLQAARARVELMESLADQAAESGAVSDLLDIFTQVAPESEQEAQFEDACRALEQVASDNGIQVNLNCE